jgi:Uncharacterized protein conserved in bacteria
MGQKDNLDEHLMGIAREVVERTLDELPEEIAPEVEQVPVFVEMEPDEADLEAGVGADWLGIFEGPSLNFADHPSPPRIRIWVRNLWLHSSGRESMFREEVRVTLLHEIGHYLGLDEDGVARLGLE